MKKILLFGLLFTAVVTSAQIVNSDFENWTLQTIYFAGFPPTVPPDTFQANEPDNWTSSNAISGSDSLGGVFFVTQSTDAYSGSSSIRMVTDSIINIPLINKITLPGFVLNGRFPITASTLTTSGNTISPIAVEGSGQSFTQRISKFKGYYKYTPVFNTNTNANDTCLIWGTLRKGKTLVANARYQSNTATSGWQPFEVTFDYVTCEMPDTLVILMASSVPNVATLIGGSSGLVPGSELLVDSIYYEDIPLNYNFPPIARPDADTTDKNTPKNIFVKLNDDDCNDPVPGLTISLVSQPANGTAMAVAGAVTYTPANNFVGLDSFTYSLSDGTASASAFVTVLVRNTSGISETNEIPVTVFPQPANNELVIQFENKGRTVAKVFNLAGSLVLSIDMNTNRNAINIENLSNGLYSLQIVDENAMVIARNKFTVNK